MALDQTSFDKDDLLACARGEMFGPGNAQLPEPPMLMMDRITDISLFEGHPPEITTRLIDAAWRNYFGTSHGFGSHDPGRRNTRELNTRELADVDPLQM